MRLLPGIYPGQPLFRTPSAEQAKKRGGFPLEGPAWTVLTTDVFVGFWAMGSF